MRTVVSLLTDLVGSTETGLGMSAPRFQRFQRAFVQQFKPYLERYALEDVTLKSTGDGWLLTVPDLEKAGTLVCLAKDLVANCRGEIAALVGCHPDEVPPIRIAICAGDDQLIELNDHQSEWFGDSARRAIRSSQFCEPDQVLANATIKEKIFRIFDVTKIDVEAQLVNRSYKWEEEFDLYSVNDVKKNFVVDLDIATADDPTFVAPYATLLGRIGLVEAERASLDAAEEEIADRAVAAAPALDDPGASIGPAELVQLSLVRVQMSRLLLAATNESLRDEIISRMERMHVPPDARTYNRLIHRSSTYKMSVEWFRKMQAAGIAPDSVTFNTLINLAPDYQAAIGWFRKMQAAGVAPDSVTFNTLIKLAPDYDTVVEWFREMQASKVAPTEVTFNTLIKVAPDYATAAEWFRKMEASKAAPTEVTFNTLIKVAPDYATAVEWFQKMDSFEVASGDVALNTLIKVAPDYETAAKWFGKIQSAGSVPSTERPLSGSGRWRWPGSRPTPPHSIC